jgi:acyl transferase domain-containing protein
MNINTLQSRAAVLVFPGQGSQWSGMAAELLDESAVFAGRLRECAAAVEAHVDWSVEDVLRQRNGAPSLNRVEVVQPVLFSVHVALAEMWLAHGLEPIAVVGQSQGEVAAACVSGALTLDDAAGVIVTRSQLFADELVGTGGIASIGLSAAEIGEYLAGYGDQLDIAGIIGPRSVTVAGAQDALTDLVARLDAEGVRAKTIAASIPSHCAAIDALHDPLVQRLSFVRPRSTRIPLYSTVTASPIDGPEMTSDYWYANARQPVLFEPAMRRLLADGGRVFVESSANPVLTAAMSAIADEVGCPAVISGTLRRGCGGLDQFLTALSGVPVAAIPAETAA